MQANIVVSFVRLCVCYLGDMETPMKIGLPFIRALFHSRTSRDFVLGDIVPY